MRLECTIDFSGEDKLLVGTFDFIPKSLRVAAHKFIVSTQWEQLAIDSHECGLVPQDLSCDPVTFTNDIAVCHDIYSFQWCHSYGDV